MAPPRGAPAARADGVRLPIARMAALCVLSGVALVFSFAPFGIFPLAWIAVAALFVAWERSTWQRAVAGGYLFGLGFYVVGSYWILPGMLKHGGYSLAESLAATGTTMALCAAHVALAALARAVGGTAERPLRLFVVMPGAWVLAELLRTYTLTGFPWLSLGYGQIDGPLAGYAPVGGVHLVSLAGAVIAGALAWAWLERPRWIAAAATIVTSLAGGLALAAIDWTHPTGRPLEFAAVQGNVTSDIKWEPSQLQPSLDLYASATQAAMQGRRLDAIVWPETAITARPDQVAPFLAGMTEAVRPTGATVIFGIIDVERRDGAVRYFNAAMAAGATEGTYHKRHLLLLGEYLPEFLPAAWREAKMQGAIGIFTPGEERPPLRVAGVTLGTTICFETAYGRLVRDADGATGLLLSLTNHDWFMGTPLPALDHQVARMRALEGGREMLQVANSGITAWIGAEGRVRSALRVRERATLFAQLQPRAGLTPYWRWGEWIWIGLVLAVGAGALATSALQAHIARKASRRASA